MSMPKRKTVIVLAAGFVLTCSGVIYGYSLATEPLTSPIFLEPAGSPHHDDSERDVCAEWFGSPDKWWIAVEKNSSVYSEIRSAKGLQFETDIGSGLSNVSVSEEFDFKTRPDLVKEVLRSCDRGGWHARPKYERQVVLHLETFPVHAFTPPDGEAAGGTPGVRVTPPN
jgi:hypothetical protein